MATAEWREPAIAGRLPVHRSESSTGYSSAGCSPAEPASASPVTDNSSSIPIQRGNQMRRSTAPHGLRGRVRRQRGVISTLHARCHFYLAPTFAVGARSNVTPLIALAMIRLSAAAVAVAERCQMCPRTGLALVDISERCGRLARRMLQI
jgi:hypothetical protein